MKRAARIAAWTAAVLVGLALLTVAGAYAFVTSDWVHAQFESRASAWSGRKTHIGKVVVDWGATTHVRLSDVQVANSEWGKSPHMLTAREIDFAIRLWPLLTGDFVLSHLRMLQPELRLERNDKEETNWDVAQSPVVAGTLKAAAPKERQQMPLIRHLEIEDGTLSFSDLKRKIDLDGKISTAVGQAGDQPQLRLLLKGTLEKQPLNARFIGGSAVLLRESETPYPIDLAIDYGATRLTVKGTVQDPLQWKGPEVQLVLSGPNLSDIYPLLGIPGPRTPPYRIAGRLERDGEVWTLKQSTWHVGDSDLAGDVVIDNRPKVSLLTAKLVSPKLVFADLAPLVGAMPSRHGPISPQQRQTADELAARGELFPNVELHVERLRAMNMDVTLDAPHVLAPDYLPVTALSFRVVVQDGVATARPLTIALAGGTVSGELAIDAHTDVPNVRANLVARSLDLGAFFSNSRYFDTTKGKVQGRVQLAGTGRSLAQVMGTANGQAEVAMAGGSVSDLMISLAGLQLADALILYIADHRIPIDCALGRMRFQNGTGTFERTLLDTRKSVLHVDGWVSLARQEIDLKIDADAKKFDLLDLSGHVQVRGKIRSPQTSVRAVFPLPHPVIGTARNVSCEAATGELLSGK